MPKDKFRIVGLVNSKAGYRTQIPDKEVSKLYTLTAGCCTIPTKVIDEDLQLSAEINSIYKELSRDWAF